MNKDSNTQGKQGGLAHAVRLWVKNNGLYELLGLMALFGAAVLVENHQLLAFVFIGLFGGICYQHGKANLRQNMQQVADEIVWVKVKKALSQEVKKNAKA